MTYSVLEFYPYNYLMKYYFLLLLLSFALFVSGQSTKEPRLEHFTTDGYELTKYIKVSETPYLMNKLTEFKKFHHTGYTNYTKERITCKEDDIPGYILRNYMRLSMGERMGT